MTETMCTSAAVKLKAGANVATISATQYTQLINQAESHINTVCRVNYTDSYSGLNADGAKILEDVASSLAAVGAINYDMSGYTNAAEAVSMVNINRDIADKGLRLLKEKQHTDFITGA
jgi:hypothetical protein